MKRDKLNIALLAPNLGSVSETFIQNHRNNLQGNVSYYYDGVVPGCLDGKGDLLEIPVLVKLWYFGLSKLKGKGMEDVRKKAFKRSLKANNIDVVVAEYGPRGAVIYDVLKQLNIPLIVHFHGYDAYVKDVLKEYGGRYTEMFAYASFIIAVSNAMKVQLIKLGAPEHKIVVNPCGPRGDLIDMQINYQSSGFVAVGRFVGKKAPYYTLLAFKQVLAKFPQAKLVMIGDGPLLPVCKNLVNHWQLNNSIEFPGALDHKQVLEELNKAFCFVQHSIVADNGDSEGTPVAVMEANLAGMPVVSTIHAGIPDVIMHEKSGFLVAEHDVNLMSSYMQQLFVDRGLAKQMGELGRKNIVKNFSMQDSNATLNHLVLQCCSRDA